MITLLAAVNSQYIHSNLAVWQLKACCDESCSEVLVEEYNINQQSKWVFADVLEKAPDVLAFSCYLWNITFVLRLCEDIHAALPDCFILLGGPEVSFDSAELLADHGYVNAILVGEGEASLPALLRRLNSRESLSGLPGLTYRGENGIIEGEYQTMMELNSIPSPYSPEMLEKTRHKIIYYEASRGCPFACSYCLSQLSRGVREKSLDRVKRDVLFLEAQGVKLLKFVDRTFNCNPKRASALWQFAAEHLHSLRLHFEIGADLLDEAQMSVLKSLPENAVQLEAGVQSTHLPTLEQVCRKTDLVKLKANSAAILSMGTIHYHLDLIAGLPYEDYHRFGESFNEVYALQPHQLQLGFLKMLKGSKLRREADSYGYHFRSYPPYEIIDNYYMTAGELTRLACVEETVERYYNSGRFLVSLPFLMQKFHHPFHFYESLADYLNQQGNPSRCVAAPAQFTMLLAFSEGRLTPAEARLFREKLRLDYLADGFRGRLPEGLEAPSLDGFKQVISQFTACGGFKELSLPQPDGPKDLAAKWKFAYFPIDPLNESPAPAVLLFDMEHPGFPYQRLPYYHMPEKYFSNGFTSTCLSG